MCFKSASSSGRSTKIVYSSRSGSWLQLSSPCGSREKPNYRAQTALSQRSFEELARNCSRAARRCYIPRASLGEYTLTMSACASFFETAIPAQQNLSPTDLLTGRYQPLTHNYQAENVGRVGRARWTHLLVHASGPDGLSGLSSARIDYDTLPAYPYQLGDQLGGWDSEQEAMPHPQDWNFQFFTPHQEWNPAWREWEETSRRVGPDENVISLDLEWLIGTSSLVSLSSDRFVTLNPAAGDLMFHSKVSERWARLALILRQERIYMQNTRAAAFHYSRTQQVAMMPAVQETLLRAWSDSKETPLPEFLILSILQMTGRSKKAFPMRKFDLWIQNRPGLVASFLPWNGPSGQLLTINDLDHPAWSFRHQSGCRKYERVNFRMLDNHMRLIQEEEKYGRICPAWQRAERQKEDEAVQRLLNPYEWLEEAPQPTEDEMREAESHGPPEWVD